MYVPQQNVILIAKHAHQLAPARRATLAIGFYKILARLQYARQIAEYVPQRPHAQHALMDIS